MTIILSVHEDHVPIYLMSDVLVSVERLMDYPVLLPHSTIERGVVSDAGSVVGLVQKTAIAGRTAMMWSGTKVVAELVFKRLLEMSDWGNVYTPLDDVLDSLSLNESERSSVSLQTLFCNGPNKLISCGHHMLQWQDPARTKSNARVVSAGSGSWDFLVNAEYERRPTDHPLVYDLIHRAAMRTIEPFLGDKRIFHYLYGGWFETAAVDNERFHKLKTAIKFWVRSPDSSDYNEGGPMIFSDYQDHELILRIFGLSSQGKTIRVMRIPDILARTRLTTEQLEKKQVDFSPDLFIHVLMDQDGNHISNLKLCPYFVRGDTLMDFRTRVSPQGRPEFSITVTDRLRDLIRVMAEQQAEVSGIPRVY